MSHTILIVGADDDVRARLVAAFKGLGVVEATGIGALEGRTGIALLVAVVARSLTELGALPEAPVIVVQQDPTLDAVVHHFEATPRVIGVVAEPAQAAALARQLLDVDASALPAAVATGQVATLAVVDHDDKVAAVSRVCDQLASSGVVRRLEAIEQCLDEMLMNALYDAAVGEGGARLFSGVATKRRVELKTQKHATVSYAVDGHRAIVAVRDDYGSLERQAVVRSLYKGLHATEKVDRKAGGAGLGLYLMANAATEVHFHIVRGVSTEVCCVFDLKAAPPRLQRLSVVVHPPGGRAGTGPGRVLASPATRRRQRRRAALAALACGYLALLAYAATSTPNRVSVITRPAGASLEVDGRTLGTTSERGLVIEDLPIGRRAQIVARLPGYEPAIAAVVPTGLAGSVALELSRPTILALDSDPTDATVSIEGFPIGATPIDLTGYAPGTELRVLLEAPGHQRTMATVVIPARGTRARVVHRLTRDPALVRARIVSTPPGAQVVRDGVSARDRTYTPADVYVVANVPRELTLVMPGYEPLLVSVQVPADGAEIHKQLVPVPTEPTTP